MQTGQAVRQITVVHNAVKATSTRQYPTHSKPKATKKRRWPNPRRAFPASNVGKGLELVGFRLAEQFKDTEARSTQPSRKCTYLKGCSLILPCPVTLPIQHSTRFD
eukprot:519365-Amphidinium_carterae.1